jgi:chromate transporter
MRPLYSGRHRHETEPAVPSSHDDDVLPTPIVSRGGLFFGFLSLGLLGFGGIAPWARHVIVERRRWLSERDYAAFVGMGQVLPGSNTINASVLIGQRFHGTVGAVIAVVGLMTMPLLVLVGLAVLYERFATVPEIRAGLVGASAAAAGMVIGTALKMAWRLRPTPTATLIGAAAFAAAAIVGLPLLLTVAVLVPLSIGTKFLERR